MPGFPVMTTVQPIIGVDMHKAIPPPPPAPPPMVPHVVVWGSGLSQKMNFLWSVAATSKASSLESLCVKPTVVGFGHGCGRTHDAGPHPAHIWPNVLLPLIMLGSGSKAEFGSGTVKLAVSPQGGGSADFAINVAYVMNMNLDCQDFPVPPLPTGFCFTIHYNVLAGFTLSDFLRGLVQMLFDMALTWLVGCACAGLSALMSGAIAAVMGKGALAAMGSSMRSAFSLGGASQIMSDGAGALLSNGRLFVDGWRAMLAAGKNAFVNDAPGMATGIVSTLTGIYGIGTPVGFAPEGAPVGGWGPNSVASKIGGAINNLFR
ncbi:MAG TPA: hypothetical protein VHU40_17225 [Polyangia bacterium]|nr:hypothetical protein [Polyangia bacterium]